MVRESPRSSYDWHRCGVKWSCPEDLLKGDRGTGRGRKTKRYMRVSRQEDTDHCTTCSLLYDTQDSRSAYSSLNSHIRRRLCRISFHQLVHQLPSSKIHTRVPKNFQFCCSYISTETRLLPWNQGSRDMDSVKDRSLCASSNARLSMCPLCSVSGRGQTLVGHRVRPGGACRDVSDVGML